MKSFKYFIFKRFYITADPVNLTHYLNQDDQDQARLFHFLKG